MQEEEYENLQNEFKLMDENNDGVLTKEEIREGFKKIDKIMSDEELDKMFD